MLSRGVRKRDLISSFVFSFTILPTEDMQRCSLYEHQHGHLHRFKETLFPLSGIIIIMDIIYSNDLDFALVYYRNWFYLSIYCIAPHPFGACSLNKVVYVIISLHCSTLQF